MPSSYITDDQNDLFNLDVYHFRCSKLAKLQSQSYLFGVLRFPHAG